MKVKLRFRPVSHSWVALHPQPKGVIQFIGGAFFGTFGPMFFYRYLLQYLFEQGNTIILLPFNFTFNHYVEAGFLIREEYEITPEIVRMAKREGYDYQAYLDDHNFSWIGHSIGCKYVALLEGFSALPQDKQQRDKFIRQLILETAHTSDQDKIEKQIASVTADIEILIDDLKRKREAATKLIQYYVDGDGKVGKVFESIFIKGQTSVLLAPVNSGTDSAIPKPLARIIDALGWGVKPTPEVTFALIKDSNLFNLLGLVCFKSDTKLAKPTCEWFINTLQKPPENFREELVGGHLRPLGIQWGNIVINFPDTFKVPFLESVQRRTKEFETYVFKLLQLLEVKR